MVYLFFSIHPTMKTKTNFKQMYLVDNVLYNKLNKPSTIPYSIPPPTIISTPLVAPSAPPSHPLTITYQPTASSSAQVKDNASQYNSQSVDSLSVPTAPTSSDVKDVLAQHIKSPQTLGAIPRHISSSSRSYEEEASNAKPFEIEENKYLDDIIAQRKYDDYNDIIAEQHAITTQVPSQPSFEYATSKTNQTTLDIPSNRATSIAHDNHQPMEYQQSLSFPLLHYRKIPTAVDMQVDENDCKECEDTQPTLQAYPPLPAPPAYPPLQAPPSFPPLQAPPAYPAILPPPAFPALRAPSPFNPPPQSSVTYPALTTTSAYPDIPPPTSSRSTPAILPPTINKLALPAPVNQTALSDLNPISRSAIPALPPPKTMPSLPPPKTHPALHPPTSLVTAHHPPSKSMVKYEGYIKNKPVPVKMTYICTRCNTSFNKQSSLINHNKRFHAAFNQSVKGVKRLSKDEINHGETKVPKISSAKRKLKQNNGRFNKRRLTYDSYPQST